MSANRYFWLLIAVLCLFASLLVRSQQSDKQILEAGERRLNSYMLADELRQTSDDLTRMARTYVSTKDPKYKLFYQEIIDIRDGRRPLPNNPYIIYWDLVLDSDTRPTPSDRSISFEQRLQQARFTTEEISILTEAKVASDQLTHLENAAFLKMESQYPSPTQAQTQAISMLTNDAYHRAKASIMRPISNFQQIITKRTHDEVQQALTSSSRVHNALYFTSALTLFVLGVLLHSIRKTDLARIENKAMFKAVFENAAVGLIHVSRDGKIQNVNNAFCRMVGYSPSELLDSNFRLGQLFYSQTVQHKLFGEVLPECSNEKKCVLTEPCRGKNDRLVWLRFFVELFAKPKSKKTTFIFSVIDITQQKHASAQLAEYRENLERIVEERTQELQKSEERFRFIAENNQDVIWTMDLRTDSFTYVSPSIYTQRGYTPEEVMNTSPWDSLAPDSREKLLALLAQLKEKWNPDNTQETLKIVEVEQPHKNGGVVNTEIALSLHGDENGQLTSVLGVSRDITKRKKAEEEIRHLAFYDGLTGLPNRQLLFDRLQQAVASARRRQKRVALLFIDLDNFKPVNDEYGHQLGDWLLKKASHRFKNLLRPYDTAARIGGDEFIVLLPDLESVSDAVEIAERIRRTIDQPFHHAQSGVSLAISSSIGIALFPDHAENEHSLLRVGDDAMYNAKRSGRNQVKVISYPAKPVVPIAEENHYDTAMKLIWRPAFECGESQLDQEHRQLFQRANQVMHNAFHNETMSSELVASLDQLLLDIAAHFENEETILFNQSFPYLTEHTQKHHILLRRAEELKILASHEDIPIKELLDFLVVDVIAQHLLTDDKQYFPYVS
ncbi:MAG: diguanylate cyclase [Deltaproteobacteria bacterium]|nr:diguanylate cyclase [Deltaproteobacteria bacterium]